VQKFSKEQIILVAEAIHSAALDRLEKSLPTSMTWKERLDYCSTGAGDPLSLTAFDRGAVQVAGMALAMLHLLTTHDSLGIHDALICACRFEEAIERLVREAWADGGESVRTRWARFGNLADTYGDLWPDPRRHAEEFFFLALSGFEQSQSPLRTKGRPRNRRQ